MQNAKDTFYLALRNRLAALNPARQITLAGATRPGILVEENETLFGAARRRMCLCCAGRARAADSWLPAMLETQSCEIFYWTCGSDTNLQMDRGRALTEMDAELAAILQPAQAQKVAVNGSTNPGDEHERVLAGSGLWSGEARAERLERTAAVQVFSLREALAMGATSYERDWEEIGGRRCATGTAGA